MLTCPHVGCCKALAQPCRDDCGLDPRLVLSGNIEECRTLDSMIKAAASSAKSRQGITEGLKEGKETGKERTEK